MWTGIVALGAWALGFMLLLLVPVHRRWQDRGDCRGLVWHTVRAPSELERWSMWWDNYYPLAEGLSPFIYSDRIVLPKSKFLVGTSYDRE